MKVNSDLTKGGHRRPNKFFLGNLPSRCLGLCTPGMNGALCTETATEAGKAGDPRADVVGVEWKGKCDVLSCGVIVIVLGLILETFI